MRRVAGCCLLLMMCAVAHASRRHESWDSVKKLAVGTQVIVQSAGQGRPEFCYMVSTDDAALTCDRVPDPDANWTAASKARVVLPRTGVLHVWQWQEDHRPSVGMWIALGLSAAFEISLSVAAGGVGAYVGALTLLAVWVAAEADPLRMYAPPRPPKMRKRLVYDAPAHLVTP